MWTWFGDLTQQFGACNSDSTDGYPWLRVYSLVPLNQDLQPSTFGSTALYSQLLLYRLVPLTGTLWFEIMDMIPTLKLDISDSDSQLGTPNSDSQIGTLDSDWYFWIRTYNQVPLALQLCTLDSYSTDWYPWLGLYGLGSWTLFPLYSLVSLTQTLQFGTLDPESGMGLWT